MAVSRDRDLITVAGLAVPWNTRATLNYWGDTFELAPGSLELHGTDAGQVPLLLDHRPNPFGYGTGFESRDDGLHATFAVPRAELDDPAVARAVRQMGNGVRTGLSIGAELTAWDEQPGETKWDAHLVVTAGTLLEVSSVVIPRFAGARHEPVAAGVLDVFGAYRTAVAELADDDDDDGEQLEQDDQGDDDAGDDEDQADDDAGDDDEDDEADQATDQEDQTMPTTATGPRPTG